MDPQLSLLSWPYRNISPVTEGRTQLKDAARMPGSALIWRMAAAKYKRTSARVEDRPGGLALIAILPPAADITADGDLVHALQRCRPHGVLPWHDSPAASDLTAVLRRPPLDLAADLTDYLVWRGLVVDQDTAHLIRRIVELSAEIRSISALARGMYMSRRALGRRLLNQGLPVPSHWLQISRIIRLGVRLQNSEASIFSLAYDAGYPDGFSVSNQMNRLMGHRPSQVREYLGWEWILEAWLRKEAHAGGLGRAGKAEITAGKRASAPPPRSFPAPRAGRRRKRDLVN